MDSLSRFGLDSELVEGALVIAFCSPFSGLLIGIVKDKEAGPAHLIDVVGEFRLVEILIEGLEWYEEYAIMRVDVPSLLFQISCPQFGAVRIGSHVLFFFSEITVSSPGISHLEEFNFLASCVGDHFCSQDGVSVVITDANFIAIIISGACSFICVRIRCYNVLILFGSLNLFPNPIRCIVLAT